jgi:hypothetical protein
MNILKRRMNMQIRTFIKSTTLGMAGKGMLAILASLILALAPMAAAQTANYVYIVAGNQHFGDDPGAFGGGGTFRGDDFDYTFNAPGVDPSKRAVLMLWNLNVATHCNVVTINGTNISGALVAQSSPEWATRIGEVPAGVLKATGNILHIAARNTSCTTGGNLDDFMIDNVVLLYQKP